VGTSPDYIGLRAHGPVESWERWIFWTGRAQPPLKVKQIHSNVAEIALLDEMYREVSLHNTDCTPPPWQHQIDPGDRPSFCFTKLRSTFLEFAVRCGFQLYVAQKLSECPENLHRLPLLDRTLRPRFSMANDGQSPLYGDDEIDLEMLHLLLSQGSDPNRFIDVFKMETVWSRLLQQCYEVVSEDESDILEDESDVQEDERDGTRAKQNSKADPTALDAYGPPLSTLVQNL